MARVLRICIAFFFAGVTVVAMAAGATASAVPSRIQAEDFDTGGEGVGYHDTTPANLGGRYRTSEAVDIGNAYPDDGTHEVGYIVAGEWLRYTLEVAQTADYVLRLRLAQYPSGGRYHIELDGVAATAQLEVPDTDTYRHWITVPVAVLHLTAGQHTLRIVFDQNGVGGGVMNLNWLELTPRETTVPGRIQAEDFDPVEGFGYHDDTAGNAGDRYRRSEGVDLGFTALDEDYSAAVEFVHAGEWLQYTLQATRAGAYVLRARLSQFGTGGTFHVEIDGANATGTVTVPDTSSYANWITLPLATRNLSAGQHSVRIVFDANGSNGGVMNLNWFELVPENPIVVENRQPGSNAWMDPAEIVFSPQYKNPAYSDITYNNSPLKGYASETSVNRGGSITFYVHYDTALTLVTMKIFRMGYYAGANGRLMTTVTFGAQPQPLCGAGSNGQIECNWNPSYTLNVPASWPSGVYLAKLTTPNVSVPSGIVGNYIPFVVRDDARTADFLYVQPDSTYQAYNNYPSVNCIVPSGPQSKSLYGFSSFGDAPAHRVSYRRPHCGSGAGSGAGGGPSDGTEVFTHELNLIAYLERQGFDVAYASSIDLHRAKPGQLAKYRAIFSVGHDEYWSTAMRDNVEEARERGVDLNFFGANAAYWQVRFEDGDKTMVGYKFDHALDPTPSPYLKTRLFRDVGRPEQWLLGVQYYYCCQPVDSYFPLANLVQPGQPTPWVYAASPVPVTPATTVDLTVGHEVDAFSDFGNSAGFPVFEFDGARSDGVLGNPARISPSRYLTLAASPFINPGEFQNSSIYKAPSGAWVFAAGTLGWAINLADVGRYYQENAIVKNATTNILFQDLADPPRRNRSNLLAGATALARSVYPNAWWAESNAIDGRRNSAYGTSLGYASEAGWGSSHDEWIEIRLPAPRTISSVVLYPRNDPGYEGQGFPSDFRIGVWTGARFVDRAVVVGYPQPGVTGQSFPIAPSTTDRILVYATGLRPVDGQYELQLAEIEAYGPDGDTDGREDDADNCPTIANPDQADGDADAVGDACDNCLSRSNPRVAADFLDTNPWATLTGGQRDDDHDGYGNKCDAKFPGVLSLLVGTGDLTQFRVSNGKNRTLDTCGTTGTRPCAIFDLDESSLLIGTPDLSQFRLLNGKAPGPKCATCPLTCAAGASGTCF